MDKKIGVAYVRVSTKSDAQLHSFEYQSDYWANTISQSQEYRFGGLYADEGISGRSLEKRPQLKKLLADGKAHKFDAVFCKSVARFGRNTVELLENVRLLRECNIRVFFEKEQIDTFDPSAEIMLTVAAAIAENDLEIYSQNMRWSIRHRYQNGWVSVGSGIFGYRMNTETNTLEIVPEEAETIRRIFDLYLDEGYGPIMICNTLEKEKRISPNGNCSWSRGTVSYILNNEKYKGCFLALKYLKIHGACKRNKGEEMQYFMEGTHEPIIPPERFDAVQAEMKRRENPRLKGKTRTEYPFSRKIVCGVCGHGYAHKINNCYKAWQTEIWMCTYQNFHGIGCCDNTRIKDSVLKEKFVECYNEFVTKHAETDEAMTLRSQLATLIATERELKALQVNHLISAEAYHQEQVALKKEIDALSALISQHEMRDISKIDFQPITEFDERKVEKFLDRVTVLRHTVTFTFINGVSISREYTNGHGGNQVGWYDRHLARKAAAEEGGQS